MSKLLLLVVLMLVPSMSSQLSTKLSVYINDQPVEQFGRAVRTSSGGRVQIEEYQQVIRTIIRNQKQRP